MYIDCNLFYHYPVEFVMATEKFSLSWNQFGSNAQNTLKNLVNDQNFTDVTLVSADHKQINAHKVILSSSSQFFKEILLKNPHPHPMVFLKDIRHNDLLSIIDFIYLGQTEVGQEELEQFMAAAKVLQVEGLNEKEENIVEEKIEANQEIFRNERGRLEPSINENSLTQPFLDDVPDMGDEDQYFYPSEGSNISRNDDGKYCCDVCDYKAKQKGHLKAHILAKHEGIKFKCENCDRKFSSKTNLQTHQHSKHEGKTYSCTKCSFTTGSSPYLSLHKSRTHKVL